MSDKNWLNDKKKLEERIAYLERENMLFYRIIHISNIINSSLEVEETLTQLLENGLEVVNASMGSILLLDQKELVLKIKIAKGLSKETIENTIIKLGDSISGEVLKKKQPLLYNVGDDIEPFSFPLKRTNDDRIFSFISVPLMSKKRVLGVINISNPNGRDKFSEYDFDIMRALASQAAIAIENSETYQRLNKFSFETILSVTKIMGLTEYNRGHCEKVAHFAHSIAHEYGNFSDDDYIIIQYSAMMHDIGKIEIKQTKQTRSEKQTQDINADTKIIKRIGDFEYNFSSKKSLLEIVKLCKKYYEVWYAHESEEKTLSDDKINIIADIITVADAYSAMVNKNSNNKPMAFNKIKALLQLEKGKLFDGRAVDILIDQVENNRLYSSDYVILK